MKNVTPIFSAKDRSIETAILAFNNGDSSRELSESFRRLADAGNSEALLYLGCMYEDGSNGQVRDPRRALECYELCIAHTGLIAAYLAAAKLHYFGIGTAKDVGRAFEYYSLLSNSDAPHMVAELRAGRMLQDGEGTERNIEKARLMYKRAIQQGSLYALIYAGSLEASEGKFARAFVLKCKSVALAMRLSLGSKTDPRLREF